MKTDLLKIKRHYVLLDRGILASGFRCRFRGTVINGSRFLGTGKRSSSTLDPVGCSASKPRRHLRAGHPGTRLWRRWSSNGAVQPLRRRRGESQGRAKRDGAFDDIGKQRMKLKVSTYVSRHFDILSMLISSTYSRKIIAENSVICVSISNKLIYANLYKLIGRETRALASMS